MPTRRTACPLDCPDTCTLAVTVDGGRLVAVDAAPPGPDANPFTQGFICHKVKRHAERVYAAERVLEPLVRDGAKGEGRFRSATWDEALERVAGAVEEAVRRHGPASLVPYLYNSSSGELGRRGLGTQLWARLGASHVRATICAATARAAWELTFGDMASADPLDVVHSRLVVVWGANPTVSNTHLPPLVRTAQEAGAPLVVVDPRRTAMAKRADLHLPVRPGTDVVLALAVAHELARRNLLDWAFLADHVEGVEPFLAAAAAWSLERAAEECGVPADDIATLAEWLATIRPALLRVGWGLERNRNGGGAVRAVLALPALTGQFGVRGAGVLSSPRSSPFELPVGADVAPPPRRLNQNLLGRDLTDPGLDPPVAVLFVQGANPAVMNPDQEAVLRGLARHDLFTVVHDQVLTDTARYADVVLPAVTHFETLDAASSYGTYTFQEMPAVIDRVGEARSNDEVAQALAARLGVALTVDGVPVDAASPAELLRLGLGGRHAPTVGPVVRAEGSTVQLRDTWPTTPGRRIRLTHPGLSGVDPVPVYRPVVGSTGSLTLISPATPRTINSVFGEREGEEPVLALHPDDGRARGVADGTLVRVWNGQAEIQVRARLDDTVRPGVCALPKGRWHRDFPTGRTANALVPATLSDLAGGACFNDARVEVAAVDGTA